MNDSLRRDDMKPPTKPAVKTKLVTRYQIAYNLDNGDRKISARLYEYGLARRLVKRLNRNPFTGAVAHPLRIRITLPAAS